MAEKLAALYRRYKTIILYLFFGGCTVIINTLCYALLYDLLGVSNVLSTILAWVAAVIFAFFTNKLYVFESRGKDTSRQIREFVSFFGCRAATGVLDVVIMYLAVDKMHWNSLIWKIVSNIIVILINYIASKFFIFKEEQN